jgi:hypothetical protein
MEKIVVNDYYLCYTDIFILIPGIAMVVDVLVLF